MKKPLMFLLALSLSVSMSVPAMAESSAAAAGTEAAEAAADMNDTEAEAACAGSETGDGKAADETQADTAEAETDSDTEDADLLETVAEDENSDFPEDEELWETDADAADEAADAAEAEAEEDRIDAAEDPACSEADPEDAEDADPDTEEHAAETAAAPSVQDETETEESAELAAAYETIYAAATVNIYETKNATTSGTKVKILAKGDAVGFVEAQKAGKKSSDGYEAVWIKVRFQNDSGAYQEGYVYQKLNGSYKFVYNYGSKLDDQGAINCFEETDETAHTVYVKKSTDKSTVKVYNVKSTYTADTENKGNAKVLCELELGDSVQLLRTEEYTKEKDEEKGTEEAHYYWYSVKAKDANGNTVYGYVYQNKASVRKFCCNSWFPTLYKKALSWYAKGEALQYDQKSGPDGSYRRTLDYTKVEKASMKNQTYIDCSSFIYNLLNAVDNNQAKNYCPSLLRTKYVANGDAASKCYKYISGSDLQNKSSDVYKELVKDGKLDTAALVQNLDLKEGDLLIVRHRGKDDTYDRGHIMMVYSLTYADGDGTKPTDAWLIHATGNSMASDVTSETSKDKSYEKNGAIRKNSLSYRFANSYPLEEILGIYVIRYYDHSDNCTFAEGETTCKVCGASSTGVAYENTNESHSFVKEACSDCGLKTFTKVEWSFKNPNETIPTAAYQTWLDRAQASLLDTSKSGHCAGMTLSAMASYAGYPALSTYLTASGTAGNYTTLWDVQKKSSSTEKKISSLKVSTSSTKAADYIDTAHAFQYTAVFQKEKKQNTNDLQGLYNAVHAFQKGEGKPVYISIRKADGTSGHALMALEISEGLSESASRAVITVYDSNYPGKECHLILEKDESGAYASWRYPHLTNYYGSKTSGTISYVVFDGKVKSAYVSFSKQSAAKLVKVDKTNQGSVSCGTETAALDTVSDAASETFVAISRDDESDDGEEADNTDDTEAADESGEDADDETEDETGSDIADEAEEDGCGAADGDTGVVPEETEGTAETNALFWVTDESNPLVFTDVTKESAVTVADEDQVVTALADSKAEITVASDLTSIEVDSEKEDGFRVSCKTLEDDSSAAVSCIEGTAADQVEVRQEEDGSLVLTGAESLTITDEALQIAADGSESTVSKQTILVQDAAKSAVYTLKKVAGSGDTQTLVVEEDKNGDGVADRIIKQDSTIKLTAKKAVYTGKAIAIGKASVTGSKGTVKYTYYTDSACSKKTTAKANGSASKGAAPVYAGTYYVKATVAADACYKSAVSSKVRLVITKKAQTPVLKASNHSFKYSVLKTKNRSFTVKTRAAKGTVTYVLKSKSNKIVIGKKTGKITVKRGIKKGTYKAVIYAKCAATKNYSAKTVKKTIKIVVK